jgi:hypothetical protein
LGIIVDGSVALIHVTSDICINSEGFPSTQAYMTQEEGRILGWGFTIGVEAMGLVADPPV